MQGSGSTPTFKRADSVSSNDSDKHRRGSVYEQKDIEAPKALVGSRIASRTQNLFKQYERDMTVHEAKPLIVLDEMDGNTGKGPSIKYVRKIFQKTNIPNPPDTHTYVCVSGG